MKAVAVPIKFVQQGITYNDLSEEEKENWDEIEWDESGQIPARVEAGAINQWLMNEDTVDKVLAHLMNRGIRVAGGDRVGKTIIFAKNHAHALFIAERFDANYPQFKGEFARVIDNQISYAQSLIEDFEKRAKAPHIAISVDMLDTGIDPGGREPGLLQDRAVQDQVLADGGPRHAPLARSLRCRSGQGVLLALRLLRQPGLLRGERGRRQESVR
jgi:hypothetical protein